MSAERIELDERHHGRCWFAGIHCPPGRRACVDDIESAIEAHIQEAHPGVLDAVAAAAATASSDWPADGVSSGRVVREQFDQALTAHGVRPDLVEVLKGAVGATGQSLQSSPVPAPPYVVVTSLGVCLRATLEDVRLVVELRAFEQTDGRYTARSSPEVVAQTR